MSESEFSESASSEGGDLPGPGWGRFRCTYCGNAVPWAIKASELGLKEGSELEIGRMYPYEKCYCGYGKFVKYEPLDGSTPQAKTHRDASAHSAGAPEKMAQKVREARYERLSPDVVRPNPKQPRRFFDAEALRGLAESIKTVGLLEDILVRPMEEGYEIVLGERRWRACQIAGVTELSAKVVELDDDETRLIAVTENLQREDLTPVEEAFSFKAYVDEGGMITDIGQRFGGMEQRVADRLKVLNSHYYVEFQEERIKELETTVDKLRAELRGSAPGRYDARVIVEQEILTHVEDGFEVVAVLSDGRLVMRRRIF